MPHVQPITIAIWCGNNKPFNLNAYLKQFVEELKEIVLNGIKINEYHLTVRIRCFVADTPARAFLKAVIGHNSYYACQKCMIDGKYFPRACKVAYPRYAITDEERKTQLRTDERFRTRFHPDHHKGYSLLETLLIDMIADFPVSDALHLFDLGIQKR